MKKTSFCHLKFKKSADPIFKENSTWFFLQISHKILIDMNIDSLEVCESYFILISCPMH